MLKKRLIGVIPVAGGRAVQSLAYRDSFPLGTPERLSENLDRWGVDEIMILAFDRSRRGLGPDLGLVRSLASLGLGTPLTYAGGIRTAAEGSEVIRAGVERLCIDSLLHDDPDAVRRLTDTVGAQALVAALPLSVSGGELAWYDHRSRDERALPAPIIQLLTEGAISEALVVDWRHEGQFSGFDVAIVDAFDRIARHVPVLAYGGISEAAQLRALLALPSVAAACVGNFLNYREHAVQHLKAEAAGAPLRPATFAGVGR
jgi:cyclase